MNFKKSLALVLSASLTLNTTFATNSKANKKIDINEISYSEKIIRNVKSAGNKAIKFIKDHTVFSAICTLPVISLLIYKLKNTKNESGIKSTATTQNSSRKNIKKNQTKGNLQIKLLNLQKLNQIYPKVTQQKKSKKLLITQ